MSLAGEGALAAAPAASRSDEPPRANPLLVLIVAGMALAVIAGGFVTVAPNRILSGKPVSLWLAVEPQWSLMLATLAVALGGLAFGRRTAAVDGMVAALAAALLVGVLAAAGHAAALVTEASGTMARTSFGLSFWVVLAGAAFALTDAVGRAAPNPLVQFLIAAAVLAVVAVLASFGIFDQLSLVREFFTRRAMFFAEVGTHVALVLGALVVTLPAGAALGAFAFSRRRAASAVFGGLNLVQTIPSIALFGLLIGPLTALAAAFPLLKALGIGGIGAAPAIIALSLYGLLPVARGVFVGLESVPVAAVEAARGMGMTERQILWQVAVPLALPVLLTALRLVVIQLIGLTVVAALIGAGGLGAFIFLGLGQTATDLILLGALSSIGLALVADLALRTVGGLTASGGRP
ncbi:osmoprotectant transport system permease protein [Pseudoxanthobacter soli DSM 19599]|uniref:Osmoprotectant transport system permease protein n=1 Tax=Pseudoxanthobacter soli DSM 19599 TaxID=1123029 RepID=A0A1M7ZQT4_9HYPH|nr:ABC transporter permease [Pseudoxanthobacter soli]SHO67268.1 osmoprotectant transport system permease protein [Pseudoxanthobacter soli DSM 19599]